MKSDTTNQSWKPTLTLAKLFEEQNQFYDALAAYELIGQTDTSPAIRQKIESLQMHILSDNNLKYDTRIEKLFSAEELAYLKILNHSAFENLSRIQKQISEGISGYEIVFEEDEPADNAAKPEDELKAMLDEIESSSSHHTAPPKKEESNDATIGELAVELIKRYGKDNKLSDMSVKDFLQLVLDFNLTAKHDKDE